VEGEDKRPETKGRNVIVKDSVSGGLTSVLWTDIVVVDSDGQSSTSTTTTTTPTKLNSAPLVSSVPVSTEELKIEDKVEVRGRDGQTESGVVDTIEDDVVYVRYQNDASKTARATPRKFVRKLSFSNTGSTPATPNDSQTTLAAQTGQTGTSGEPPKSS